MEDKIDSTSEEFLQKQQQIYRSAYITLGLLAVNIIVFIVSGLIPDLYYHGAMYTEGVIMNGEFYRILTATFLHANIGHLFNNMIMLGLAGAIVENYMGHGLYFIMYILAGVFGNLLSMAYEIHNDVQWITVGASGSVMGVVGFISVWIVINRKALATDIFMLIRLIFLLVLLLMPAFSRAAPIRSRTWEAFLQALCLEF